MCEDDERYADEFSIKIRAKEKNKGKKDNRVDGYIVDDKGKIVGEARSYDPYSRQGEVMLYEIDVFGYTWGYISEKWQIMSKEDLMQDKKLRKEFAEVQYKDWKKYNLPELHERWDNYGHKYSDFEKFCKYLFNRSDKNMF